MNFLITTFTLSAGMFLAGVFALFLHNHIPRWRDRRRNPYTLELKP